MKTRIVIFIMLVSFIILAFGDETLAFMLTGKILKDSYMITMNLPDYWELDLKYAEKNGLAAFFSVTRGNDISSAIVMNLYHKDIVKNTFDGFIKHDTDYLVDYFKGYSIKYVGKITNKNRYNIKLFRFYKDSRSQEQYIAYFDCGAFFYGKIYIAFVQKYNQERYLNDFRLAMKGLIYINIKM